jgi:hypothetical protein
VSNAESATEKRLPSIGQRVNRSNSGHLQALRDFARLGHGNLPSTASMGDLKGFRTLTNTLDRWECTVTTKEGEVRKQVGPDAYQIIERGEYVTRLTQRGQELLAALEARA